MNRISCILLAFFFVNTLWAVGFEERTPTSFWEKVYMPLECGLSLSSDSRETPGFLASTSLEYRPNIQKGIYYVIEFNEHTHGYTSSGLTTSNANEGDIFYLELLLGSGWRKPLNNQWRCTTLLSIGPTRTSVKNVLNEGNNGYRLQENCRWIGSGKVTLGLEYKVNRDFEIFLKASCLRHLSKSQLEEDHSFTSFYNICIGFNWPLF